MAKQEIPSAKNGCSSQAEVEMNRIAMRVAVNAFAELQFFGSGNLSDSRKLLEKYILMCPYVEPNSPVVFAALEEVNRSQSLYNLKWQSTTESHQNEPTTNGTKVSHQQQLNDVEVMRAAVRLTMNNVAQLYLESETLSDQRLLEKYVLQCPYLPPDSPVIAAALKGIKQPPATRHMLSNKVSDPDFVGSSPLRVRKMPVGTFEVKKISGRVKPRKRNRLLMVLRYLIRAIILDVPIMIILVSFLAVIFTQHLYSEYWGPLLQRLPWNDDRALVEQTYYHRYCDVTDMSTQNPNDLFLDPDATSEEAYRHQLLHGFTVFPKVLTEETASALRDYIISKNHGLSEEESIFVIENENRYSFGLGTEEPSVAKAVGELATHPRLVPALEKILGKNPALIEMTAITSAYGAVHQHWHDDVVSHASAIQFGRTFGPSYSIFVQLQNTTKSMGATAACPGSHLCPAGPVSAYCKRHGFQLVNAEGIWSTGDALLMNMNSWHRGSAHTAQGGADRVMLILTFVPKPKKNSETRQMSQGITFSLRWDMWGHTLEDLAAAETRMSQPWATLRALGLYKPTNADWGIDYISGSAMRMASGDNGYKRHELDDYIERGGIKWLPRFLHGRVDEGESWQHYYVDTLRKCEEFTKKLLLVGAITYIFLQLLILLVGAIFARKGSNEPFSRLGWSVGGTIVWIAVLCLAYKAVVLHVDSTQWARDIKAGRLYVPSFSSEEVLFVGPSTYPYRDDILIETRYASAYLDMYNDFVNAHPGNLRFWEYLGMLACLYTDYGGLPGVFREHLSERLVDTMLDENRRFLYQNAGSDWVVISRENALQWTTERIRSNSNDVLREIMRQLRYLMSECKYGRLRGKPMADIDIMPYLDDFGSALLASQEVDNDNDNKAVTSIRLDTKQGDPVPVKQIVFPNLFGLDLPRSKAVFARRSVLLHYPVAPTEPKSGAWVTQGDAIEVVYLEDGGRFWYYVIAEYVTSNGIVHTKFHNGDKDEVSIQEVRTCKEIGVGEIVQLYSGGEYVNAQIIQESSPDHYHIHLLEQPQRQATSVHRRQFRRRL